MGEVVEVGTNVYDFAPGRHRVAARATSRAGCAATASPAAATCAPTRSAWASDRDGAFAEYVVLPMTNVWHHWPGIDEDVAAIFDPFGNAVHTALAFPVLGEDVLVTGAGPIGLMATAVVAPRRRPLRRRVSEPNAVRRALAERMGATLTVDPRERDLDDVQRELGMVEGFDVVLEMSGNPAALRRRSTTWPTAAAIAILGIPTEEIAIDINEIVFKMLTVQGIYGREMYETWYKMTVMLQSGLDITARDHPPLPVPRATRRPSRRPAPATRARSSWTGDRG